MVDRSVSKISSSVIGATIIVKLILEMKTCLLVNIVLVNKLFLCLNVITSKYFLY